MQICPSFIVKEEDVKPEDQPPTHADLEDKRIGLARVDGIDDPKVIAPPISDENGVIVAPRKKEDDLEVYITVQIESAYPGGLNPWKRVLQYDS